MPISYVSAGAVAAGTGAVTVGLPSGLQTDDLMLMVVETANQTVAVPGIWLDVPSSPQGTGTAGGTAATRLKIMYRWEDGTTPDTTLTDPGNHVIARIVAYRGVDTANPFNASAGSVKTTASTTATFPNITTTVADCWVLLAEAHALPDSNSTGIAGTRAGSNLTGVTERIDNNTNAGNGGGFSLADGLKATAGSVTGGTVTLTTSTVGAHITLALAPAPLVERTGSMAASETGTDAFSSAGDVFVQGTLAATETGADTFAATGTVTDPAITGTFAATETGNDTFAATGDVIVRGSLAVSEVGSDTFSATGDVIVRGSLSATEAGADAFAAIGDVIVQGTLAAAEVGSDTFVGLGGSASITGTLAATEAGADNFTGAGDVFVRGAMAATESGGDVAGNYVEDGYTDPGYYLQAWTGTVSGTPPEPPPAPEVTDRGDGVDARWTKKQRKARDKRLEQEREDREKLRQVIEQIIDPQTPEPVEVVATKTAVKVTTVAAPITLPKLPTIDLAEIQREVVQAVATAQAARREQAERAAMQAEAERVAQENIRQRIKRRREEELLMLM